MALKSLQIIIIVLSIVHIIHPLQSESLYPSWAHEHFVWLTHSSLSQAALDQLVDEYTQHDIPVGGINIDSGWSTGYNNFVVDEKKFSDFKGFIQKMHDKNIKVIAWATSIVNVESSNYQEGLEKNYYVKGIDGITVKWWHGTGSFLDYSNGDAVDWYHRQMDNVLDLGLDGFKCDGSDPMLAELIYPMGKKGHITLREYADAYYRDFFHYTREKRGDGIIWARGYDNLALPVPFKPDLFWRFAPHDVGFSLWTGDNDPTFEGLKQSLRNVFESSWNNYTNLGSDIGGYRGGKFTDPIEKMLGRSLSTFVRWFQYGAFTPLMENGGAGEHRPWIYDEAYNITTTLPTYRLFVHIHRELIPYFWNAGKTAYASSEPVIKPISEYVRIFEPTSWDYLLWKDIFVAPMIDNSTIRSGIRFPDGDDWIDWWNEKVYHGGQKLDNYPVPLTQFPVFKRKGSIIPLNVTSEYAGHGNKNFTNHQTYLISHPVRNKLERCQFMDADGTEYAAEYRMDGNTIRFAMSSQKIDGPDVMLIIRGVRYANLVVSNQLNVKIVERSDHWSTSKPSISFGDIDVWIRIPNPGLGVEAKIEMNM